MHHCSGIIKFSSLANENSSTSKIDLFALENLEEVDSL